MAKKARPTFSAPPAKAATGAAGSEWVYRSDAPKAHPPRARAAAAHHTPARVPARPRAAVAPPVAALPSSAAAPRSGAVVTCAAAILLPVAIVNSLILQPLAACFRRKP